MMNKCVCVYFRLCASTQSKASQIKMQWHHTVPRSEKFTLYSADRIYNDI